MEEFLASIGLCAAHLVIFVLLYVSRPEDAASEGEEE